MKRLTLILLALMVLPALCPPAQAKILFVKQEVSGTCTDDWSNACTLQAALGLAASGDEIWVAQGTYKPTDCADDADARRATFQLKSEVGIYGGFLGVESTRDQRNWTTHETILSGDIGISGDNLDNSYHVVTGSSTDASTILDGLTITAGNADAADAPEPRGGGILSRSGSLTLSNCTFRQNLAFGGGGIYSSSSSLTLTNCTFSGNAGITGGGIYSSSSSLTLTNCTFSGNAVTDLGGGIRNSSGSLTLTNCTFSGNAGLEYGGGIYSSSGSLTLTNCTFSGNRGLRGGGGISFSGSLTLTNCILYQNTAYNGAQLFSTSPDFTRISHSLIQESGGSGESWDSSLGSDEGYNIDADPLFVRNPNPVDGDCGDLHLQAGSPAIDVGDTFSVVDLDTDLDGNPRIVNGFVDMGAYEYSSISQVAIDIKPQGNNNVINWRKDHGMVAVGIVSTPDFDAPAMVDQNTLTFGRTGDEASFAFCNKRPKNINGGKQKDDLLCHFYKANTDFQCGDTQGILKGQTKDGMPIEGRDLVRVVPCR